MKNENFENEQNLEQNKCKCACEGEACECGDTCECEKAETEAVEVDSLSKLEEAAKEANKYKDLYMRAVADLDTFKRRTQRDIDEIRKYAMMPLAESIIPVIDNFKISLMHMTPESKTSDILIGVNMILNQMLGIFNDFGIKEINPLNEEFNPQFHESVAHEASDEIPENKVSKVIRTGYVINGRLIRPASVVVSSGKNKE